MSSPTAPLAVEFDGLPPPGTPLFLPTILAHVRITASSLPIDPVVLQAILLGVISGGRNVILRTREDDVQAVARLTALTLTTVFGYTTHRTKFAPEAKQYPPDEIVNALFIPPSVPAPSLGTLTPTSPLSPVSANSGATVRGITTSSLQHHRSLSRGSTIKAVSIRHPSETFGRSSSYHGETVSPTSPTAGSAYAPSVSTAHAPSSRNVTVPDRSSLLARGTEWHTAPAVPTITYSPPPASSTPLYPGHPASSTHVRTRTASTTNSAAPRFGVPVMVPAELPQAVVVSGLEHTGIAAQRDIVHTLRTRELAVEVIDDETGQLKKEKRKLPEGFVVVYVCRSDPRERPAIYKSLLDHFALSATVTLQPSTRTGLRHRHPSTNTPPIAHPSPRSLAAAQSSLQPFLLPATPPVHINPATTPPAESSTWQAHRVSQSTSTTSTSPVPSPLSVPPSQPGQPTAPSTLPALLPSSFLNTLRSLTKRASIRAPVSLYLADLLTATRHAPELDGALLTARCRADIDALARAARVLGVDTGRGELIRPIVGVGADDASMAEAETEAGASQSTESFFTSEANAVDGDNDERAPRQSHPNGNGHALPFPRTPSIRSHRTRNTTTTGTGSSLSKDELDELRLDVAEADIARVFPRAVSHRVRVRPSPADEVLSSALCGAVGGVVVDGREVRADDPEAWVRSEVKEVLVQVLADV